MKILNIDSSIAFQKRVSRYIYSYTMDSPRCRTIKPRSTGRPSNLGKPRQQKWRLPAQRNAKHFAFARMKISKARVIPGLKFGMMLTEGGKEEEDGIEFSVEYVQPLQSLLDIIGSRRCIGKQHAYNRNSMTHEEANKTLWGPEGGSIKNGSK